MGPIVPRHKQGRAAAAGLGLQVATAFIAAKLAWKLVRSAGRLVSGSPRVLSLRTFSSAQQAHLSRQLTETEAEDTSSSDVTAREQWRPTSSPAPTPPKGSQLVCQAELAISVYDFYEQFLSIETTCLQDHHKSTGQSRFRASRWKEDGEGLTRNFAFVQPKRGMMSAAAQCSQDQHLAIHPGSILIMTTDMTLANVPCCECFRVQSFWQITPVPDPTVAGCTVKIFVEVPFSKWCMLSSVITKTTLKDCTGFFSDFLAKVQHSIATELPRPLLAGVAPITSPFAAVDAEVFVRQTTPSSLPPNAAGGVGEGRPLLQPTRSTKHMRLSSRASRKPSFAQPMSELQLPGHGVAPSTQQVLTVQSVLLVMLVLVQMVVLYDMWVLRQQFMGPVSLSP